MRNQFRVQTAARSAITLGCILLIAGWTHPARGFTPLGPFDTWQTADLTYQVPGADIGGPQNLGEEYRFSAPTVYVTFDSSFLNYFGSNGVAEVQKALKFLNSIPSYSTLSQQLTEYPLQSQQINYQAQALLLLDVKSYALHMLVEQMGLAEPERYSWTLRARILRPGAMCPGYNYSVIHRNFDPATFEPTPYVNGTLYSYQIVEFCPAVDQADAIEFQVDPLAASYTSVAGLNMLIGGYFTGLTRDDVGGLRYVYRKSNYNTEALPSDTGPAASSPVVASGGVIVPWTPVNVNSNGTFGGIGNPGFVPPWTPILQNTNNSNTNVVPPTITSSNLTLRAGVDKVTFVQANYDSLLGEFFIPFTSSYTSSTLANGQKRSERVTRVVVQPDIIFSAADIGVLNPSGFAATFARTSIVYQRDPAPAGVNGPGTLPLGVLNNPTVLTFNKVGTVKRNFGPFFIDEAGADQDFTWASFDGSTNSPVLYPNGISIMDLEAQILSP